MTKEKILYADLTKDPFNSDWIRTARWIKDSKSKDKKKAAEAKKKLQDLEDQKLVK